MASMGALRTSMHFSRLGSLQEIPVPVYRIRENS